MFYARVMASFLKVNRMLRLNTGSLVTVVGKRTSRDSIVIERQDTYFVSDYRSARLVIENRSGKLPDCLAFTVVEISLLTSSRRGVVERYDVDYWS